MQTVLIFPKWVWSLYIFLSEENILKNGKSLQSNFFSVLVNGQWCVLALCGPVAQWILIASNTFPWKKSKHHSKMSHINWQCCQGHWFSPTSIVVWGWGLSYNQHSFDLHTPSEANVQTQSSCPYWNPPICVLFFVKTSRTIGSRYYKPVNMTDKQINTAIKVAPSSMEYTFVLFLWYRQSLHSLSCLD